MNLKKQIEELGFNVKEDFSSLIITKENTKIIFWKRKQWSTGKDIEDGRGIEHLLNQLKSLSISQKPCEETHNHIIGTIQKVLQQKLTEDEKFQIKKILTKRFNISIKE